MCLPRSRARAFMLAAGTGVGFFALLGGQVSVPAAMPSGPDRGQTWLSMRNLTDGATVSLSQDGVLYFQTSWVHEVSPEKGVTLLSLKGRDLEKMRSVIATIAEAKLPVVTFERDNLSPPGSVIVVEAASGRRRCRRVVQWPQSERLYQRLDKGIRRLVADSPMNRSAKERCIKTLRYVGLYGDEPNPKAVKDDFGLIDINADDARSLVSELLKLDYDKLGRAALEELFSDRLPACWVKGNLGKQLHEALATDAGRAIPAIGRIGFAVAAARLGNRDAFDYVDKHRGESEWWLTWDCVHTLLTEEAAFSLAEEFEAKSAHPMDAVWNRVWGLAMAQKSKLRYIPEIREYTLAPKEGEAAEEKKAIGGEAKELLESEVKKLELDGVRLATAIRMLENLAASEPIDIKLRDPEAGGPDALKPNAKVYVSAYGVPLKDVLHAVISYAKRYRVPGFACREMSGQIVVTWQPYRRIYKMF